MPSRRESARPGSRGPAKGASRTPGNTRPGSGRDGTARRRTATSASSADKAVRSEAGGRPGKAGRTTEPRASSSLTGRAAVVLLVLGALVVSYAQSLRVWFDQHQQITALTEEIDTREQRVGQLQDEISRWNDDAYVRAQARQRLGWVMPGEVGYRVVGADGKPLDATRQPTGPAASAQNDPTWYAKLWGSVEVAGSKAR